MKKFKLWNTLCGWIVFAIAAATYLLTIEPTASFWDCGEFISSAYKLDVGHPPGAPFFMLMGHFFSLFAKDPSHVAMCCNAMSALASAFTILFLFWTITALGRKLVIGKNNLSVAIDELQTWQIIAILGAGAVGALAYTFSDTFWFSAVEGEVYASSSLFTAAVFWLILKWDEKADEEGSDKWLILIAYLMGLSIGVHLLNLLTIPAIVLVYYFRRYRSTGWGALLAILVSAAILAAVLYGIIPGFPTIAGWFELLFVNKFGLPYNTGLAVFICLTIIFSIWAIIASYRGKNRASMNISFILALAFAGVPFLFGNPIIGALLIIAITLVLFIPKKQLIPARVINTTTLMVAVVLIGYSSYAALVIRSSADTPMDQNSPDNVFSLKYYLNREQYGDRPLFFGQYYNAPVEVRVENNMYCVPVEKVGHAQYAPAPKTDENVKDEYIITGHKTSYKYISDFCTFFPRMYSSDPRHKQAYIDWGGVTGREIRYEQCGQSKKERCPTFIENMRFFFSYQCNYMYWRYFLWNFAGRQNDLQGYGEITKGNWLSGIPFIDNWRLGDQSTLPQELRNNKGHNVYYMLPLLLGLLGIAFQFTRRKAGVENFVLTFLLFFLTGLAIVVYLNQTPYQPRERDYAYAGSFYAFCIWIGLGAMGIASFVNRFLKENTIAKTIVASLVSIVCLGVPALMAQQNWDDHDRSGRYTCRDFGANYLKSCEKDGIIFSNGDNDTFPLWYNQEVEGVGTDLRVCNLSYVQTDWYISQMKRPYYESDALPISWQPKDYITGTNEVVWVEEKRSQPMTVKQAFDFIRSDKSTTKKRDGENYLPTAKLYIPINPDKVVESGLFDDQDFNTLATQIDVNVKRNRLTKSEMMVLEMLSTNQWQRPMYFAVTVGNDYYQGLEPYFELTGLAYQITPFRSYDGEPRVNTEKMYDNMMNKFKYGNINKEGIYIDENLMRMCRTHRMMFAQLADALMYEGQKEKAIEVLDRAEVELPGTNIPYDYTSATMATTYYRLGETEKANAIMTKVADNSVEYLQWISALKPAYRRSLQQQSQQSLAILGYVLQNLERFGQNELFETYFDIYQQYASQVPSNRK